MGGSLINQICLESYIAKTHDCDILVVHMIRIYKSSHIGEGIPHQNRCGFLGRKHFLTKDNKFYLLNSQGLLCVLETTLTTIWFSYFYRRVRFSVKVRQHSKSC